jgi:uncharacterized protein (TIGR03435 family)
MLTHLVEVSTRSLLIAFIAALVLVIGRSRRSAALQHAVWLSVVCGMLALFAIGGMLPELPLHVFAGQVQNVQPATQTVTYQQIQPFEVSHRVNAPSPATRLDWARIALWTWATIALIFIVRLLTGMHLVRKLMGKSTPVNGFFESDFISVPLTMGWLRPRVMLPTAWREWSSQKLSAVLVHEEAHVRRRDGLAALLAGLNRSIFWFHPLAWFLERKLALLAEEACDETCVATLGDRESYARILVEMASVMDGSHRRLRYHALTMAAATHLRQRIDSLLREGRAFSRGLSRPASVGIAACTIPLVLAAGAVELKRQPDLFQMELPHWNVPAPPALSLSKREPILLAQASVPQPQTPAPAPTAKFDSATIKRCEEGDGAGRGGRGGAGGRGFVVDPGSFFVHCMSLAGMLNFAINDQGGLPPLINDSRMPQTEGRVRGGPAWVNTELYTIDARTADPVANQPRQPDGPMVNTAMRLMGGQMLMSLLEDRFQLRLHSAVEQVPMYALTVAPGGIRLKPFQEGECVNIDRGMFPYPGGFKYGRDPKPPCNWIGWGVNGPNRTFEGGSVTMSRVAELGDLFMDRHILEKTGIEGKFNVHLEYLPDEHTPTNIPMRGFEIDPSSDIPRASTIFRAIEEQLGLRLESTDGPHGYVAIDSVERPNLN